MPLVLTSGPSVEPVTLAEAKAHCRIDSADDDILIGSLIVAARMHIERSIGLALITQSWSLYFDVWPPRAVEIPLGPLQSISAVRVYDAQDEATLIEPEAYLVDIASRQGRLVRRNALTWPTPGRAANGIEIASSTSISGWRTRSKPPSPNRKAPRS